MSISVEAASFRDPSGFVFYREETLLRQVQQRYKDQYDRLLASGLYDTLVKAGLLISHTEESLQMAVMEDAYRILRPERVPFISYPYEWCFSQLRDAALATLRIQKEALKAGMSLKDASAYNIQFKSGQPIFIDTLSFDCYEEGRPWIAYRQFCQHFLAPLVLMSHVDIRLGLLLRDHIDGIPLDLTSRLLPRITWLNPGLLAHIHLHGAAQKRFQDNTNGKSREQGGVSKTALFGLIDNLETTISKLAWKPQGTTWAEYYGHTNYSDKAMEGKSGIVSALIEAVSPQAQTVWDLGANTGLFSRLASNKGIPTVAWDMDPAAVEKNYRECLRNGDHLLLPLIGDLTNPSPDLGWALNERRSIVGRGPADLILALALIHHLAIGNNVPFDRIAAFMASVGHWLIVEYVPKGDSQVQRLLANKEDIFDKYGPEEFEAQFGRFFEILRREPVPDSSRVMYLMRARNRG